MEVIVTLAAAGVVGGLAMAAWLFRFNRAHSGTPLDSGAPKDGPTDIINMAHIRVEGVGGVGMVLMAIAVALGVPQVGKSMATGLLLGGLLAVLLVRWRQKTGPMPSSGQRPGANTTLAIDAPDPAPLAEAIDERHDARIAIART
jgi:hypothetical protein